MSNFKLCAFADEADPLLEGQIRALKENEISFLEVRGVNGQNITELTLSQAKEIHRQLHENGIQVWSVGSPIGKISLKDDFAAHLELLKHTLELGEILEAANLRLFSFFLPKDNSVEECEAQVMEQMGKMLDVCGNFSLTPCHENEKGIYGSTAACCAKLHKTFPTLKAVFDPANFIQCGQAVLPAWQQLEKQVEYFHVKDALSDGNVVPAGFGEGHLPELLAAYQKNGGQVLTVEPHLTVFNGLEALERPGETSLVGSYRYPTARAAFDAAVNALKTLL